MGKNKDRRPHLGAVPPHEGPRTANDPASIFGKNPVWRLALLDLEGPFGFRMAEKVELERVLDRLRRFESMTWGEIQKQKSCGEIAVGDIGKEARERLAELGRDDIDVLVKLRVTGAERLWGVRREHVFFPLWWDPNHRVYPMNLADN